MKRSIAMTALVLFVCAFAWAQVPTMEGASSTRYTVWSDAGKNDAAALASTLDGLFSIYNEYFRFDETQLKAPLTVRKFSRKTGFDAYLTQVLGQSKDDFVYLHYPTADRSELVIFVKESGEDYAASLAHQAFVQYLKAFIPEPPLWIREGFAVYFEKAGRDPVSGLIGYQENQAWLETTKLLKTQGRLYSVDEIMLLSAKDAQAGLDVFYPQSWAMIAFFLNSSDRRYNRFIWDAIGILKPEATLEQNQGAVYNFFLRWHSAKAADSDFLAYLDSQKTFAELVSAGVRSYGDKDLETAGKVFAQALVKNSSSYIPPYYLGLIAYARNDHVLAEEYYKKALQLGSDEPITNYALGINAFASRRFEEARNYLGKAAAGNSARYEQKVRAILDRIPATPGR